MGFTVTAKLGNAVIRNRIKRRLKAAVRASFPAKSRPGHDYAVIGRRRALSAPFETIVHDLEIALDRVHKHGPKRDRSRSRKKSTSNSSQQELT